jgi:ParB family chromosome partitioning protein
VSDTDTTEEEKENARRLHILKMLEKYYIYMNEDDLRCLEAMLKDCKRRKREYGLDDAGSTL